MSIFDNQGFAASTKFVTDKGLIAFKDCFDGQVVNILTNSGKFEQAVVGYLDILPVSRLEFMSNRSPKVVHCTDYMPWVLNDGEITDDIEVGDTLEVLQDNTPVVNASSMTVRNCEMFVYGIAIGCGVDTAHKTTIHMLPEYDKYLDIFKKAQCVIKDDPLNGYNFAASFSKRVSPEIFMRARAWRMMTAEDMRYIFAGIYVVFHQDERRTYLITMDEAIHQMVEEISAVAGYHITAQRVTKRGNRADLHKYNYLVGFRVKQPANLPWKLSSMRPSNNREQKCWTIMSETAKTFILENGLVACCAPLQLSDDKK